MIQREPCSGLWRSQSMVLLRMHMQRDVAHDTIYSLGQLGCVQFVDLNPGLSSFQRQFTNDVRRCDRMEQKLRFCKEQVELSCGLVCEKPPLGNGTEPLDELEPKLESVEAELKDLTSKWKELLIQKNNLKEHLEILKQHPSFFRGEDTMSQGVSENTSLMADVTDDEGFRGGGLRYVTGVMNTERFGTFERLVYRAVRGNMFMRTTPAVAQFQDHTGKCSDKTVFVVFFSGARSHEKVQRLCDSLQASLYPYNIGRPEEVATTTNQVEADMAVLEQTLQVTESMRSAMLKDLYANLYSWNKTVVLEKSVFDAMNQLNFQKQTVMAECWAPQCDMNIVQDALRQAETKSGAQTQSFIEEIQTCDTPPTYYKTNRFTVLHQGIVDAYGIARYKEVNPTCFSMVTFPFLFGVMYGDIGHGCLILIISLFFCYKEKEWSKVQLNEILEMVFTARYLLVMMSLFAIYMGFLYNDNFGGMQQIFGDPFWIFPTGDPYKVCDDGYVKWYGALATNTTSCKRIGGTPVLFGLDGNWAETSNKLEATNGLKMKMAVILGVAQMMWGLVLSAFNHIYYRDMKHIFFGVVPEMLFLMCTFGYMDVMIIGKWCVDWTKKMALTPPHTPTPLLETMQYFFLSPARAADPLAPNWLFVSAEFQQNMQIALLLVAVAAIPLLLIPIPVIEYHHMKNRAPPAKVEDCDAEQPESCEEPEEGSEFSEVVIKQIIHTIEFVLGCVSNTASYLRLWALSLAHSQLSEVFWQYVWMLPLSMDNGIGIIVFMGWAVWFGVTLGVLGMMESMSAFLHALRLHWVEFQNKFYFGDGYQYIAYSHSELVTPVHLFYTTSDAE